MGSELIMAILMISGAVTSLIFSFKMGKYFDF
jgi:hypothetical protein